MPHEVSADGKFSWEEVECLGACANAPMAQIGKDFYEDLTAESFAGLLDALARGEVPRPGSQNGRFSSEPAGRADGADADAAGRDGERLGDARARARRHGGADHRRAGDAAAPWPTRRAAPRIDESEESDAAPVVTPRRRRVSAPRDDRPDDLKLIKGVGPVLEALLHRLGYYHFDQIAAWTPAEVAWVDAEPRGVQAAGSSARAGSSRRAQLAEDRRDAACA